MSDKGYYGGVDAEAIHAGFEAERADLAERANRCQDKNGCFGSDPEATAMLVEFGDVGVTIGMERVAVAAHTAAIAGKPFETATFTNYLMKVVV